MIVALIGHSLPAKSTAKTDNEDCWPAEITGGDNLILVSIAVPCLTKTVCVEVISKSVTVIS